MQTVVLLQISLSAKFRKALPRLTQKADRTLGPKSDNFFGQMSDWQNWGDKKHKNAGETRLRNTHIHKYF